MSQIYKEKGLLDVAQGVKAPRLKVETNLEEKFDKELDVINKKMYNTAQASSTSAMNDLYNTHSDNPIKLQEALDKVQIDTADLFKDKDTKDEFLLNSEVSKISYMNRSKNNFKKKQDKEFKFSSNSVVDTNIELMKENAISMWNGDEDAKTLLNESYTNIQEQLKATDSDGSPIYTDADIRRIENEFSDMKVDSYKDKLDSDYLTNVPQAEATINDFNSKTREQLGLTRDEYDDIKKYNKTVKEYYTKLENKMNPKTKAPYTEEERLAISRATEEVRVIYEDMNLGIGKLTGKDYIKNSLYDNVGSLIDFRNSATAVYESGGLSTKTTDGSSEYNKMMMKTSTILMDKIKKEDVEEGSLWSTTIEERLAKQVNSKPEYSDYQKTMLFERSYNRAMKDGINLLSHNSNEKKKIDDIIKQESFFLTTELEPDATDKNAVGVIYNENVSWFNPDGDKAEGVKLDNDYNINYIDGKFYNTLEDENGEVIFKSEALINDRTK